MKLAVLGDPLAFTLSPVLHRAGLESLGLAGTSEAFPTPAARLEERLAALDQAGYRGANLTHPLKEAALARVARVTDEARRARSVNTVGFAAEGCGRPGATNGFATGLLGGIQAATGGSAARSAAEFGGTG